MDSAKPAAHSGSDLAIVDNSAARSDFGHHSHMASPRKPLPTELKAGPFTLAQGRNVGLTTKRMRGRDLDRPFRGVRVSRDDTNVGARFQDDPGLFVPPSELLARCAALAVALGHDPVFSHVTAARLWPLPLPRADGEDDDLHVSIRPPGQPPRRNGVVGHKLIDPHTGAVRRHGRWVVDPASMFCQLSARLPVEDLVVIGDALIFDPPIAHQVDDRPWLTLADLTQRVGRFRGRGKTTASRALALVRPGVESRPETLVRLALVGAGLPEPEVNVEILAPDGTTIGRGDLVYRTFRVIVEYDGDHHRADTRQYDKDLHRIENFARHGWVVVRLTSRTFFTHRDACLRRIEQALVAGGWVRP